MARIYVSSTLADLKDERQAVLDWIRQRHDDPVHSYVADTDTVRASCIADVAGCDVYVLLIAWRYGTVADGPNPHGRSITELEYEAALEQAAGMGLRVVVILVEYVGDPRFTDLRNKDAYNKLLDFRDRVTKAHRPAQIERPEQLIPALEAALAAAAPRDPWADPEVQRVIVRLNREAGEHSERIEALQRENAQLREQLAAAVARTLAAGDAAGASAEQASAAAALRAGDAGPAQELLRQDEQQALAGAAAATSPEAERAARVEAATLARERGALAMASDVAAAYSAFQSATQNDPADLWGWFLLGDMAIALGDLAAAEAALASGQRLAAERAGADASDDALRDLSVSHERIGNVRVAQGDGPAALAAFEASLAIRERLAARDPANTQWQRDLSVSHGKIGDVRVAQGDLPAALAAFDASLAIDERLAALDPANTQWQRDLSVSHNRIGDVRVAQGDLPAALAAYEASLAIDERLAALDPANTEWQRDLSVSHNKIGDVRVAQGDLPAALAAFEASLAIRGRLAARDPAHAGWQVDLAVSCSKLGTCAALPEDARRRHLRRGLEILEALAAAGRLAPNRDWRDWFREQLEV